MISIFNWRKKHKSKILNLNRIVFPTMWEYFFHFIFEYIVDLCFKNVCLCNVNACEWMNVIRAFIKPKPKQSKTNNWKIRFYSFSVDIFIGIPNGSKTLCIWTDFPLILRFTILDIWWINRKIFIRIKSLLTTTFYLKQTINWNK